MLKNSASILAAASAILPVFWFSPMAFPTGEQACADPVYSFNVVEETLSNRIAADAARKAACKTVASLKRPA